MLTIAERLEGLYSNASTHAAGVVIGDRPLTELVPLYRDPKAAMPATQFNMKWVEPAGLVKFDFLGLKTLTTLQRAHSISSPAAGSTIDLGKIPLDDAKTYEMLGRGETVGVFQLESAGMRKALVEMRADRFEDIIALVALYRPGPMANIPTYCARKLGAREAGLHPSDDRAHSARDLRRHHLPGAGDADRAGPCRAIRSAKPTCCAARWARRSRRRWTPSAPASSSGAVARGLTRAKADEIFDLLGEIRRLRLQQEPCGGLCADRLLDRLVQGEPSGGIPRRLDDPRQGQHRQARRVPRRGASARHQGRAALGQRLRGRFRRARRRATASRRSSTRSSAIKGVGEAQAEALVKARGGKPFASLADMASRLDPRLVNKKALESLAAAGAFDELEPDRASVFAAIEPMLAIANRGAAEKASGQNALFGDAEAAPLRVSAEPVDRGGEAQARVRRRRLLPLGPSARRLRKRR